jgi:hypothetical protein
MITCINKHFRRIPIAALVFSFLLLSCIDFDDATQAISVKVQLQMPADLTQYFYHVFVLSQKLGYLYGYPDFFADMDNSESQNSQEPHESQESQESQEPHENPESSDLLNHPAIDLLTIFMGVMMGAPVAEKGINELSKAVAENAVTRLPRVALTKAAIYPVVSQVAKVIGSRLTKDSFAKGVGRFIPLAGGLFSGGLTLYTFRRGANRLRRQLHAQRHLFDDGAIDTIELAEIKTSFVKANKAEHDPQLVQLAIIQAMINMANISDNLSPDVQDLIEEYIAKTELSGKQQIELLENLSTEYSFDVDYDVLACDPDYARQALQNMIAVMNAAGRKTMAEKMYLSMVTKTLGVSKEELDQMMQEV